LVGGKGDGVKKGKLKIFLLRRRAKKWGRKEQLGVKKDKERGAHKKSSTMEI